MAFAYGYVPFGYGTTFTAPSEDYSGGAYNPSYHFQAAQNAGFSVGTSDPRTLYVGNLDPNVTEEFLASLFGQIAMVTKAKIIIDPLTDPYGFIEFADHYGASLAISAMNGRILLDRQIKVNWAIRATQPVFKVDTSKHFNVFVGDLSLSVDEKMLRDAFAPFGNVSDVKVIKDQITLKPKGYGFISYPTREEAEIAIEKMNGQWIGGRVIRTNWSTRKHMES